MKTESKIKQFIASLKTKKHLEIIIAVIAVAVMLVIYFSARANDAKTSNSDPDGFRRLLRQNRTRTCVGARSNERGGQGQSCGKLGE